MKLRKTLAGILGAVVMLLGVGTFEHVNRETGVHAATETNSINFKDQGLTNGTVYTNFVIGHVNVTFASGGGTDPKYYTTGTGMRAYAKNTITFDAGEYNITKIVFTFGTGDGSNGITASVGSFSSPIWTGKTAL